MAKLLFCIKSLKTIFSTLPPHLLGANELIGQAIGCFSGIQVCFAFVIATLYITVIRHECYGISNHWQFNCLFNDMSGQRQNFALLALGEGNPLVTGGFPHKGSLMQYFHIMMYHDALWCQKWPCDNVIPLYNVYEIIWPHNVCIEISCNRNLGMECMDFCV